jgi:Cu-processing system ATP-binding protein
MIQYREFTKRFGGMIALDRLTLEVRPGEVVALLGPNGSGKTTALKGAAGLIRATSGEVVVGDPPGPACQPRFRSECSYLPQKVSFPDALTGREVLEFYRALRGTPASSVDLVLRFAALNGAAERPVGTYSGGMVQRLGLAVAVLPDAPVLLLDEPTAALDPEGLCAFYGVAEQRRGKRQSVFFTSHQLGDVERLADRVAVLVGGRLAGVFSQHDLADRLAARGVMRVQLERCPPELVSGVRRLAPGAVWASAVNELVVPAPASLRPRVLDVIRGFGVEINGLTAEEGRLDALYRELVEEHR